MLTIPKAAKEFGIPYQTLLRLVHEGEIVKLEIPGRRSVLLDPADIQAFIDRVKSGSVIGSEDQKQPPEMALNKESRKHSQTVRNGRKSNLDHIFARGRKSCS